MDEKAFCLLDEPWIKVITPVGATKEVGILELFRRAHEFIGLAGELPAQDAAVMRLLLAILHAVFGRFDVDGGYGPVSAETEGAEPGDALERWKNLWDRESFPMPVIEKYLNYYRDRFWLIHPEYPFYQAAGTGNGTEYTSAKLNGEISESNNKIRLFPQRTGEYKETLSLGEAARWLLYVNAYDDTSSKAKGKNLPSPGAGWLGKLGLIYAAGDNLFQTLLLNTVMLRNGENILWGEEKPVWERKEVITAERTEITIPDNLSQLYTLQSRRLLLKYEGGRIIGYTLLGGDFFEKEDAFTEQMTVWRSAAKEDPKHKFQPKRHDPSRQLWRDFSAIIAQSGNGRRPGIVNWLACLKFNGLLPRTHFKFQTAAVKYGDKDFFVDDAFGDSISFNAGLLTSLGKDWVNNISEQLEITDKLVWETGRLAQYLAKAAGYTSGYNARDSAKEQAYFRLDIPFRNWLESIDPQNDGMNERDKEWWSISQRIIRDLGKELTGQSGLQAFTGRTLTENKIKTHYSAPEAYNRFIKNTSSPAALSHERSK